MECDELLYGKMCALKQKAAVYKNYVKPAIFYGNETWCVREGKIRIM